VRIIHCIRAICLSTAGQALSSACMAIWLGLWITKADHIATQDGGDKNSGRPNDQSRQEWNDVVKALFDAFFTSSNSDGSQQSKEEWISKDEISTSSSISIESFGLVEYMLLFSCFSLLVWSLAYIAVPEINGILCDIFILYSSSFYNFLITILILGLHLEDIDMYLTDKQQLLEYKRLCKGSNNSKPYQGRQREDNSTNQPQVPSTGTVKYGSIFGGSDGIDESLYGRSKSDIRTVQRAIGDSKTLVIEGEACDVDELDSTVRAGRVGFDACPKEVLQKKSYNTRGTLSNI
jgi:hypothetical protein